MYRKVADTLRETRERSVIETRNRVDRQLSVHALERFEVEAVLVAAGEALEANQGAQRSEGRRHASDVDLNRAVGGSLVVERRRRIASSASGPSGTSKSESLMART